VTTNATVKIGMLATLMSSFQNTTAALGTIDLQHALAPPPKNRVSTDGKNWL